MNLVFTHHPLHHTLNGVGIAAMSTQLNASLWQPKRKPVFDMMEEKKPTYLFCTLQDITPIILDAVEEYRVRIVLFENGIPTTLSNIGQPFLLCYGDDISEIALKNLDSSKSIQISKAANYAQYKNGKANNQDKSDVFYLSQQHVERSPFAIDILNTAIKSGYQFKSVGDHPLPLPQYLGKANIYSIGNLIASAKVCIDFNGHSVYDIAVNNSVAISTFRTPFFESFTTVEEFKERLDKLVRSPKLVRKLSKVAKPVVLEKHTYYHRLKDIGHFINEQEIVDMCNLVLERIVHD